MATGILAALQPGADLHRRILRARRLPARKRRRRCRTRSSPMRRSARSTRGATTRSHPVMVRIGSSRLRLPHRRRPRARPGDAPSSSPPRCSRTAFPRRRATRPPPFNGPRFPAIAIRDNVEAARRLLTTELGVTHLRAIVGFSMGAQQAFQWAVSHPDFVDRDRPLLRHGEDVSAWHGAAGGSDQRAHRRRGVRGRPLHVAAEEGAGGVVAPLGRVGVVAGMVASRVVQAAVGDGRRGSRVPNCARRRARCRTT